MTMKKRPKREPLEAMQQPHQAAMSPGQRYILNTKKKESQHPTFMLIKRGKYFLNFFQKNFTLCFT